jgi:hypothetical protein
MKMEREKGETNTVILMMSDGKKKILTTTGKEAEILAGGIGEFFHTVGNGGASIGLRIPIDQVKDIDSAKNEAREAGLGAEVRNYGGYKYLEISDQGYDAIFDWKVVEKLRDVARKVSKEDYSHHIESLEFSITRVETVK